MDSKQDRAPRSPSPEGQGRAREAFQRAWQAYARAVSPATEPVARWVAVRWTEDLVGFWLIWHLHGGYEGMRALGMSRSSIYRRITTFRRVFGEHPDVYRFPGVSIDLEEYLAAARPLSPPEEQAQGVAPAAPEPS